MGSKVQMAVDMPGNLLTVRITPANEQERAQVAELARFRWCLRRWPCLVVSRGSSA